eukprot:CAMPEP_0181185800 /NCGR_PEP_ID=MMETSP1096-20121128/9700_1 /TAXON_ID=156174 ORGANISM="Chrysochromulina ericina, Strain CCMP281" /NCGR_SAMPLE_ID=MMETSP1096 /ASSEMBLY_ACC=CAM_ASM_000453 /LENGTH=269 /DNA_ID=CAMNT_0023274667 /DNA_START=418 /DNA_END=1227 /DNA_ORIENTATION=+
MDRQQFPLRPCPIAGFSGFHTTLCGPHVRVGHSALHGTRCVFQWQPRQLKQPSVQNGSASNANACDVAGSEGLLPFIVLDPRIKLLTILRDPRDHVKSMFAFCQQQGLFANTSLERWLNLSAHGDLQQASKHCFYDPWNMQTVRLAGGGELSYNSKLGRAAAMQKMRASQPSLQSAMGVIQRAAWVGVTRYYDASICLLQSILQTVAACSCAKLARVARINPSPGVPEVDASSLAGFRALTSLDTVLYARAMLRLQQDLKRYGIDCFLS